MGPLGLGMESRLGPLGSRRSLGLGRLGWSRNRPRMGSLGLEMGSRLGPLGSPRMECLELGSLGLWGLGAWSLWSWGWGLWSLWGLGAWSLWSWRWSLGWWLSWSLLWLSWSWSLRSLDWRGRNWEWDDGSWGVVAGGAGGDGDGHGLGSVWGGAGENLWGEEGSSEEDGGGTHFDVVLFWKTGKSTSFDGVSEGRCGERRWCVVQTKVDCLMRKELDGGRWRGFYGLWMKYKCEGDSAVLDFGMDGIRWRTSGGWQVAEAVLHRRRQTATSLSRQTHLQERKTPLRESGQ
ncbi:hypothetical protein BJ508DRAFT_169634 [Ascobolus immersus RN42]|uniref:Uncharacterized protein n=1 Tax=Ascobolus immersus RN42 TaxID=1160509 RepID=A0A3N4HWC0_ASCIM|nr:hypothetical protein BJ508DRAFT_169634 [Ascobolus immersus RN42]